LLRRYSARVVYQQDGSKYLRTAEATVTASCLGTTAARAIAAVGKEARGWREPFGATFSLHIVVGPRVESGKERLNQ